VTTPGAAAPPAVIAIPPNTILVGGWQALDVGISGGSDQYGAFITISCIPADLWTTQHAVIEDFQIIQADAGDYTNAGDNGGESNVVDIGPLLAKAAA